MSSRVLSFGLLVGAIAGACLATHRNGQRRVAQLHASHAAPVEVQTWEGEGGAVPVGAGRIAEETRPDAFTPGSASRANGAAAAVMGTTH